MCVEVGVVPLPSEHSPAPTHYKLFTGHFHGGQGIAAALNERDVTEAAPGILA